MARDHRRLHCDRCHGVGMRASKLLHALRDGLRDVRLRVCQDCGWIYFVVGFRKSELRNEEGPAAAGRGQCLACACLHTLDAAVNTVAFVRVRTCWWRACATDTQSRSYIAHHTTTNATKSCFNYQCARHGHRQAARARCPRRHCQQIVGAAADQTARATHVDRCIGTSVARNT